MRYHYPCDKGKEHGGGTIMLWCCFSAGGIGIVLPIWSSNDGDKFKQSYRFAFKVRISVLTRQRAKAQGRRKKIYKETAGGENCLHLI